MPADSTTPAATPDITTVNRLFYDALWAKAHLARPDRFNTWPLVSGLLPRAPMRLEIGPGLRPRLPIAGTHFIDISQPAITQLAARGGVAAPGHICALPFDDGTFDLVCALDIIEHVDDDRQAFAELSRVLKDGAALLVSVPVHADRWTAFDRWVGHVRRYDPADLLTILADNHIELLKSAVYGMQPSNPALLERGMWWLEHHRSWAMFWYNRVGLPLAMFFQKPLDLVAGLVDTTGVDEVVLLCRRTAREPRPL
jgi:SAM-dependent methyltransferase